MADGAVNMEGSFKRGLLMNDVHYRVHSYVVETHRCGKTTHSLCLRNQRSEVIIDFEGSFEMILKTFNLKEP